MNYDKADRISTCLESEFKLIPDPRSKIGLKYSLPFLLNCAACATMSGANGFAQIYHWVKAQPKYKLRRLGLRVDSIPEESTIRKAIGRLDMDTFRSMLYSAMAVSTSEDAIAVDGKTLKGSRDSNGKQLHILSMTTHGQGITIGDRLVPGKKSELKEIRPLLETIDIKGKVITADALHSMQDFGEYLTSREADYVWVVKGNRKKLITRLENMDIKNHHSSYFSDSTESHGRFETRSLYLADEIPWWLRYKSAAQAFLIERTTVVKKTGQTRSESIFGVTSLSTEYADAKRILEINRGHWTIENRVFHVRDVTFNEDRSRVRAGSSPEFFVCIRNLVINIFRKAGQTNIAAAIRSCLFSKRLDLQYLSMSL